MAAIKTVMVELDALLDTRLATLDRLDPKAAHDILEARYWERTMDDFGKLTQGAVTNEAFWDAYRQRDVETLKRSRCTELVVVLDRQMKELEARVGADPEVMGTKVVVNTYPYRLDDDERASLVNAVMAYAGVTTEVTTVSLAYEDLTPSYIKQHWDHLYLYEFDRWFALHQKALRHTYLPRVKLTAPAFYLRDPSEAEDVDFSSLEMSPFTALEISLVERLHLELGPASAFSLIRPRAA